MNRDEKASKAIAYIEANLDSKIDLDETANIMCEAKTCS